MAVKKKAVVKGGIGTGKKSSVGKKSTPAKKPVKSVKTNELLKKPAKADKPVTKKVSTKSDKTVRPLKTEKPSPAPAPVKEASVKEVPVKEKAKKKEPVTETVQKAEAKPAAKAPAPVVEMAPAPKKSAAASQEKVVIPDIKTKTVRKYEPDFTKSVLDSPMQEHTGPSQRYSDSDLSEFRELINKKLEAAKKELNYLQGLITRKDEMGGDESDNRYMTMEDGSISMEREQLSQMASRQITFIDHLEKALMRIESKTYGVCRVTGKLIDKARLRAVPHATLSIEAKQTMNR